MTFHVRCEWDETRRIWTVIRTGPDGEHRFEHPGRRYTRAEIQVLPYQPPWTY